MTKTKIMGGIPFEDAQNAGLIDPGFNESHGEDEARDDTQEDENGS